VLRIAVGGFFAYAGWTKLTSSQAFADSISTFQLFPAETINIIVICLPVIELLLGVMLVFGYEARAAALGIFFLTFIFTVILGQAALRGLPVDCGCLGSRTPSLRGTYTAFARSLGLLVCALYLYRKGGIAPS
jgi:uncharacterized membrane protein YphA (DoxX/SURF4 family)